MELKNRGVDIESERVSDLIRKWDDNTFEKWQETINSIQTFTDVKLNSMLDRIEFDRVSQLSSITKETCKFKSPVKYFLVLVD